MAIATTTAASATNSTKRSRYIELRCRFRESFHILGNDCRQLHHSLTVFRVLSNRPLNEVAISFQLLSHALKFIDEAINFPYRELSHLAKKCAEIVGCHFMFRARWMRHDSLVFRLAKTSRYFHF